MFTLFYCFYVVLWIDWILINPCDIWRSFFRNVIRMHRFMLRCWIIRERELKLGTYLVKIVKNKEGNLQYKKYYEYRSTNVRNRRCHFLCRWLYHHTERWILSISHLLLWKLMLIYITFSRLHVSTISNCFGVPWCLVGLTCDSGRNRFPFFCAEANDVIKNLSS